METQVDLLFLFVSLQGGPGYLSNTSNAFSGLTVALKPVAIFVDLISVVVD